MPQWSVYHSRVEIQLTFSESSLLIEWKEIVAMLQFKNSINAVE